MTDRRPWADESRVVIQPNIKYRRGLEAEADLSDSAQDGCSEGGCVVIPVLHGQQDPHAREESPRRTERGLATCPTTKAHGMSSGSWVVDLLSRTHLLGRSDCMTSSRPSPVLSASVPFTACHDGRASCMSVKRLAGSMASRASTRTHQHEEVVPQSQIVEGAADDAGEELTCTDSPIREPQ